MKAMLRLSQVMWVTESVWTAWGAEKYKRIIGPGLSQRANGYPLAVKSEHTTKKQWYDFTTTAKPHRQEYSVSYYPPRPTGPECWQCISFSFFKSWWCLYSHSVLSTNQNDGQCYQPASRITREIGQRMFNTWNIVAVHAGSNYIKWTDSTCTLNNGDTDIDVCYRTLLLRIYDVTAMRVNIVQTSSVTDIKQNSTHMMSQELQY